MAAVPRAASRRRTKAARPSPLFAVALAACTAFVAGLLVMRMPISPGPETAWTALSVACWLGTPAAVAFAVNGRHGTVGRWLAVFPGAAAAFAAAIALHSAYIDPLGESDPAVFTSMFVFVLVPQALVGAGAAMFARLRTLSRRAAIA